VRHISKGKGDDDESKGMKPEKRNKCATHTRRTVAIAVWFKVSETDELANRRAKLSPVSSKMSKLDSASIGEFTRAAAMASFGPGGKNRAPAIKPVRLPASPNPTVAANGIEETEKEEEFSRLSEGKYASAVTVRERSDVHAHDMLIFSRRNDPMLIRRSNGNEAMPGINDTGESETRRSRSVVVAAVKISEHVDVSGVLPSWTRVALVSTSPT
jgi:hypothetical protein